MITNNYKNLLSFYLDNDYKDVSGTTRKGSTIFGGIGTNTNYDSTVPGGGLNLINGYQFKGTNRSFNYGANTATNSFTNEQTTYRWQGVLATVRTSGTKQIYTNTIANGFVIFVGTGDTAVTENDFKLATPAVLDVTSASCASNANGKTYVQRTFQNNTGADVTIKELGCYIFTEFTQDTDVQTYSLPIVMIGRTVLETPVTIANGDSQTFTYVIENVIE